MASKQEMLTAVNDAIQVRLTGGAVASYGIGGRNLQYISLRELTDLRDKLQREISDTKGSRNYASFVRPS